MKLIHSSTLQEPALKKNNGLSDVTAILPLENKNSDEEDDGAEEKHQTASAEDQDTCKLSNTGKSHMHE